MKLSYRTHSQLVMVQRAGAVSSCGKYFTTQSIGFGAAWPSAQIDAPRIAFEKFPSRFRSQTRFSISADALAVSSRQRAHWPQDSFLKKRSMLRAASTVVSRCDSTITAERPMEQP